VHRRRGERRRGRQRRSQGQHDPFADPVDEVTPGDQRRDHAEAGHRCHQPGLGQVESAFGVQRRDQEGDAVDEHVRKQGGHQGDDKQ
jgi:hypothetical protein